MTHVGKRAEEDEHKRDATGSEQADVGPDEKLYQSGNNCGENDHGEESEVAKFFFKAGANEKDEDHVAHQVVEISVAKNVGKPADVRHGVAPAHWPMQGAPFLSEGRNEEVVDEINPDGTKHQAQDDW